MSELTIRHTSAGGTLIEGTARGDGSADVLRANGWRWGRSIGTWYVQRSRDRAPDLYRIERSAAALRAAGFTVTVEVDATPRDQVQAEDARAERLEERADALDARAARRAGEARARTDAAHRTMDLIPVGQPILVGHHSERRHRRDLARIDANLRAGAEAGREAERAAAAAATARAHMDRREDPQTVARRIERLAVDLRDVRRKLAGTSRNGMEYGQRAEGLHREQLEASAAHLVAQLDHWRQVRADQVAAGDVREWSAVDFEPGDLVLVRGTWRTVARVNRLTVSVETGYSWTDRVEFHRITERRRPGQPAAQVEELPAAPAPEAEPTPAPAPIDPEPAALVAGGRVPVLDLVGHDVAGRRAQVRTGQLAGAEPWWRTLRSVELRRERVGASPERVPWVYWTWEPEPNTIPGMARDCGYSGTTVERARADRVCIELEAPHLAEPEPEPAADAAPIAPAPPAAADALPMGQLALALVWGQAA
jgi:hypothetical protein